MYMRVCVCVRDTITIGMYIVYSMCVWTLNNVRVERGKWMCAHIENYISFNTVNRSNAMEYSLSPFRLNMYTYIHIIMCARAFIDWIRSKQLFAFEIHGCTSSRWHVYVRADKKSMQFSMYPCYINITLFFSSPTLSLSLAFSRFFLWIKGSCFYLRLADFPCSIFVSLLPWWSVRLLFFRHSWIFLFARFVKRKEYNKHRSTFIRLKPSGGRRVCVCLCDAICWYQINDDKAENSNREEKIISTHTHT